MDLDTTMLESRSSPAPAGAHNFLLFVSFSSGAYVRRPDPFLTHSGTPAWKRLIDRPFYLDKQVSLTTHIFSDRDETETVRHLRGDDAQSFVDVVDQVISPII